MSLFCEVDPRRVALTDWHVNRSPRLKMPVSCSQMAGFAAAAYSGRAAREESPQAVGAKPTSYGRVQRVPSFGSLRVRLVATVLVAITPALILLFVTDLPWIGFVVGFLALVAAWIGGEKFVLRQVRLLCAVTKRLARGDLSSRTGLDREPGELGELARSFDRMAATLEQQTRKREEAEKTVAVRAQQQTALAAVGQFALLSSDLSELLNHAASFTAQTLGVDFCGVLELLPHGRTLLLRAGTGWRHGCVGRTTLEVEPGSQGGYTLFFREPLMISDFDAEDRFRVPQLFRDHGAVSGVEVVMSGPAVPFGVLGVYTTHPRAFGEDEVHFLQAMGHVLATAAERMRTESELQKLAAFARFNPDPIFEFSADGNINYCNEAAVALVKMLGKQNPKHVLPENLTDIVRACLDTSQTTNNVETRSGSRVLCWSFHPLVANRVVHCHVEDITNRLTLEAQLRHAQKMQSVGQLAAGVAHDFNNMLTVIQGYAGVLGARTNLPRELTDSVQAISFAAERAANLTRQLLMFSRKNVMQLRPLDLRVVVGDMLKLLKRLLGETITLKFDPPAQLPLVQMDRGMIEQVMMNLVVNARDAMSKGGTLAISTAAVEVNRTHARTTAEARAGSFVCLQVSDTGCGMDPSTLAHIFEPFFTTKELGKGTGLGLATVYGIIKQHEGWVEVHSEVGRGTTFSIYLPPGVRIASTSAKPTPVPSGDIRGGRESVLVVEDESALRDLATLILREQGYHVIGASNGDEALSLWDRHPSQIDLLLTDMVMPGEMSGRALADKLRARHTDLKVLFTSGYTEEAMNTDGIHFLQKPYDRAGLARAVRDCLDSPTSVAATAIA